MKGCVEWDEINIGRLRSPSPGRGGYDECDDHKSDPAKAEESAFDNAACCSRKKTRQSDGWSSSEDEDDETEQTDEDAGCSFKEHRRAHYDEFLKVKELRQQAALLENGSDEDNNPELAEEKKPDVDSSSPGSTE